MTTYSYSRLGTLDSCPRKYYYQYVAKIKLDERPQSIVAFLGSRVHDTLESTREVCSADVNGDGVVTQQISRCFSASGNRILGIPLVSMAMMLSARLPLQPCWAIGGGVPES